MKYKLLFMISTLLFTSCVINKSIHIVITNSSDVEIDAEMRGSQLEDLAASVKVPLLP